LTRLTEGTKQTTKRNRYSCLKAFFNYIRNTIDFEIQDKGIDPKQRIFPIAYNAARVMVKKADKLAGVNLRPHDLRRHAATLASRSGTPIEIVGKVILRHAHHTALFGKSN
jgi:integrase